jgi:hypothetical protein
MRQQSEVRRAAAVAVAGGVEATEVEKEEEAGCIQGYTMGNQ